MKQQIGKLRPLLHQIQLGHPFRFAFEFSSGNANQFAQYIPGIIESERLIKITGKKIDRKSTRLNSSHGYISYAVFCLKKKKTYLYTGHSSSRKFSFTQPVYA